jgi:Enolase C-terminal domain-like
MLRECAGDSAAIMFDANQQWALPAARQMCRELARLNPLWIEEPTRPDDLMAHIALSREIAPVKKEPLASTSRTALSSRTSSAAGPCTLYRRIAQGWPE